MHVIATAAGVLLQLIWQVADCALCLLLAHQQPTMMCDLGVRQQENKFSAKWEHTPTRPFLGAQ